MTPEQSSPLTDGHGRIAEILPDGFYDAVSGSFVMFGDVKVIR